MTILMILGGLVLLVLGGEFLVRGSVRVAEQMGISPLLIGLTLVGFGTSTPELVTSVQAALIDAPGIALGNIVGSNIANVLLILGASAIIFPLAVGRTALKRDGAFVLATAIMLAGVGLTVGLTRWVGVVFIGLLIAYLVYAYRQERHATAGHTSAFERAEAFESVDPGLQPKASPAKGLLVPLATAIVGLGIIILGGRILVDGAVELARDIGMSEEVIGLTIVAVGTSMPELITSVVAALRKQSDVAVGNILGSNIYNILGIGGITALIAPTPFPPQIAAVDTLILIGVSLLLLLFAWTGKQLSRWEGAAFIALYAGYIVYLVTS